jgi:hypothetical protein
MRRRDGELADALRAIGNAKSGNDALLALRELIELSPALNGQTGERASLAALTHPDDDDVVLGAYIYRPDWKGPTYVYDAMTHMAYYDQLGPQLYAKIEDELDEAARRDAPDPEPEQEPEQAPAEPERLWA